MTQHHHTPPPDPMPLDPEERALAARLARLGPHGEPSPALDARVLAAAHAAATAPAARSARERGWRRARWPVGVGVAASVVLAAGIAWQMRPLPAPQLPAGAPARADAARSAAPESRYAMVAREDAPVPASARTLPTPPPPPPLQEVASAAVAADDSDAAATAATETAIAQQATPRDVATAKSLATPLPAPEPPVVFDAPAPVDVAVPAPPPPAPPAAPAPAAQGQVAQPVFDASEADAPEGDVPPATAASPQVRDAWLARIRELAATGRADEARASLAEFHRRYPAFAIPADLRPLLPAAAAAPAPAATPSTQPPPR